MFKDKLIYDGSVPADGDSVAAFLHASLKLTSTTVGGMEALDVNIASPISVAVDLDGFYVDPDNATPDTVGSILHERGAAPDETSLTFRPTGGSPDSDSIDPANVFSEDSNSFLHGWTGTAWERVKSTSGKLLSTIDGNVADDGVDSGNPIKVGSRAVSGALTAVSTTGDRADLLSDLYRRIWVNDTPNVAGSNAAVSVDTTSGGVALFASPLAGRRRVQIYNLGGKAIFYGFGTVSAANGIRLPGGANAFFDLGPDLALKAISESGTQDVRVLQLA